MGKFIKHMNLIVDAEDVSSVSLHTEEKTIKFLFKSGSTTSVEYKNLEDAISFFEQIEKSLT